ncbi:MAG: UvrD-helicase domain-containing protein [Chitinophagales bacterium]
MLRIYKASAGSGKTYTLVKEFLRIALKRPDSFKHILAITFTNKAANEMKERIVSMLGNIKSRNEKAKELIEELGAETGLSEAEVVENADGLLKAILHNYGDLNVSTIDSFVHRIVRSFAHDLHLSMNFSIEMDRDKLLNDVVELLMDRLHDEDDQVTNAVVEFAESNIEEGKSWNVEHQLIALAKELFNEDAIPHLEELSHFDLNEIKKVRSSLHAFVKAFEGKLCEEGKKAYDLILAQGLNAKSFFHSERGIFGFFRKYAEGVFPTDMLGNSYVLKTINEGKWGGGKISSDELSRIDSITPQLVQHYQNIVTYCERQSADYHLAQLLLNRFYAFILLADIQKLLEEYKKENNILHISEFQQKIHAIVREQDAPIIYERIGEWFNNILIDEHQDTSVLQWQNLVPLIENSQFKTEESLVVGDGKQAIYRFRNGKVEQFAVLPKIYGSESDERLKEREIAINNYGTESLTLKYNFRSRKHIVEFNNSLYNVLGELNELADKSIYEGQQQLQGRKEDGGLVSLSFLPDVGTPDLLDEERCKRVEELITDARNRGYGLNDIAILTRNNKNGSLLASWLIGKGVPVISSESLLIDRSPKVKLLLAVLNYFDQRENHIARAEIVYYVNLLSGKTPLRFEQFDFKAAEEQFELQLSQLIDKDFRSYNFLSYHLNELIYELMHFFGLSDADPFLQYFMDEVMAFSANNRSNIREFLGWWEEVKYNKSIIYPETLDAVRLMTIHKSKGLQFPVVIMADADWPKRNSSKNFWVRFDKPWLPGLHLGILSVTKDVEETEFAYLYEQETASSFLDMLNLVYVATTRAEDMLYILSTEMKNEPKENNSVTALWITYLKALGVWEGFREYTFGDAETKKEVKAAKKGIEVYTTGYLPPKAKQALKIAIRKKEEKV